MVVIGGMYHTKSDGIGDTVSVMALMFPLVVTVVLLLGVSVIRFWLTASIFASSVFLLIASLVSAVLPYSVYYVIWNWTAAALSLVVWYNSFHVIDDHLRRSHLVIWAVFPAVFVVSYWLA